MKILFAFLLSLMTTTAFTQDNWKASLDKKALLNTSLEDAEKNVVKITVHDLQRSKSFILSYKAATAQKGWERTIVIYDEKDRELKKQPGQKLSVRTSELKSLFQQSKTLKIYTINLPTDPKLKAQVRVRRVHLCTLILQ
jgi:hypothetical protein